MGMGVDPVLVDAAAKIWTTTCISRQPFIDLRFGIKIRASTGAIVRENDSDRNSRTYLGTPSARRDGCRCDVGRD